MFTSDWAAYRRRRIQFFAAYLALVPMLAVLAVATGQLVSNDTVTALILAPGSIAFLLTALRMNAFYCPRCSKPFFLRGFGGNPITSNCLHCNFPKWSTICPAERERWHHEPDWNCLSCHATMDSSFDACTECGWTYDDKL